MFVNCFRLIVAETRLQKRHHWTFWNKGATKKQYIAISIDNWLHKLHFHSPFRVYDTHNQAWPRNKAAAADSPESTEHGDRIKNNTKREENAKRTFESWAFYTCTWPHTHVRLCVCKWTWDLWSVLPRRLAVCNDWQELIQQMMESHYVPDRLELKTAILPYDAVTGHRLNRGSRCQCKKHDFFFFLNDQFKK